MTVINSGLEQLKEITDLEYLRFFLSHFFTRLINLSSAGSSFQFSMDLVESILESIKECHDAWIERDPDCMAASSSLFSYMLSFLYVLSSIVHYDLQVDEIGVKALVNLVNATQPLRNSILFF